MPGSTKWSPRIVVEHILERYRKGLKLNSGYMQIYERALYQAGCAYWGSWRKAIEAAGIRYDDVRVLVPNPPYKWNKQKIIAIIRERFRAGKPLNSNHIQTKERLLYGAALKYFGGWRQAIVAAGLDYEQVRTRKEVVAWTCDSIVAEIQRRYRAGLSMGGAAVYKEHPTLYVAAKRHFGTGGWAKARVRAGLSARDPKAQKWTKEKVIEELRRLDASGIALNVASMMITGNMQVYSGGIKRFGSWPKSLAAAGIDPKKARTIRYWWWTKARVLRAIRSLAARGIRLSSKDIQLRDSGLFAAAVKFFGSWSQAVEAAGISYRAHSRTFSIKAWLRRMQPEEYQTTLENARKHARIRRRKK